MSKLKSLKKGAEKIIHSTPLSLWISAGCANPGPPLGPQIGQVFSIQFEIFVLKCFVFFLFTARNQYCTIL